MARTVLLSTQIGQDFIHTPASQNVWLAGMAEGMCELGLSVQIPWVIQGPESQSREELARIKQLFWALYGVGHENVEFVDSRELEGTSLPHRFDVMWTRDPALLSKRIFSHQVKVAEYHGGSRELMIPQVAAEQSIPLVTVTKSWAKRFGAHSVAEPGALRVFFRPPSDEQQLQAQQCRGVYVGGLDPDRIDGVGVKALRQLISAGAELDVIGGNLEVEVDLLRWRLGRKRKGARFFGYLPPTLSARIMHQSNFAIALKSERSAPSAPIKLIAFAAASLPLVVSSSFLKADYSGPIARTLRAHPFRSGFSPDAAATLRKALSNGNHDVEQNYQIALDNTFSRRIEKTGLLGTLL